MRLTYALIDQWVASYRQEPDAVTLDIDDSVDVVHGCQQLSLFNADYDERCFLPIPIYDTERSRPVAVILRPGKTPSGVEIRNHLRRLVRRIRRHWSTTRITFRGDSHYACPEVMSWCEANGISYVPACSRIATKVGPVMPDLRSFAPAETGTSSVWPAPSLSARRWKTRLMPSVPSAPFKTWMSCVALPRPNTAQDPGHALVGSLPGSRPPPLGSIAATSSPTSRPAGTAEWLYDSLYCARGQAENLIKLHKTQLASDRTSCRSPLANQVRLVLHTAAYWLMLAVRDAIPNIQDLAKAEFKTLRLRLLKIAARITETKSRIRVAFATACPDAALFRGLATALQRGGP